MNHLGGCRGETRRVPRAPAAPYGLAFERAPITRTRRIRRPRATRSRPTLTVLAVRRRLAGMNAMTKHLGDGWRMLDAEIQRGLRESSDSITGAKETMEKLHRMGICRKSVGPDDGGWFTGILTVAGLDLAEYGRDLVAGHPPEDVATAADRRLGLLTSCLPALKLFREDLVADGLLHKLPGLDRIIGEVEAEVG